MTDTGAVSARFLWLLSIAHSAKMRQQLDGIDGIQWYNEVANYKWIHGQLCHV